VREPPLARRFARQVASATGERSCTPCMRVAAAGLHARKAYAAVQARMHARLHAFACARMHVRRLIQCTPCGSSASLADSPRHWCELTSSPASPSAISAGGLFACCHSLRPPQPAGQGWAPTSVCPLCPAYRTCSPWGAPPAVGVRLPAGKHNSSASRSKQPTTQPAPPGADSELTAEVSIKQDIPIQGVVAAAEEAGGPRSAWGAPGAPRLTRPLQLHPPPPPPSPTPPASCLPKPPAYCFNKACAHSVPGRRQGHS